jgi:integrase
VPVVKLSAALVERADTEHGQERLELHDELLPGFGLRVTAKGRKSWFVFYRLHGRLRRYTIGSYPAIKLSEARELAREASRKVQEGADPLDQKRATRRKPTDTVAAVAERFIELWAKRRNKTWSVQQRILAREVLPLWGRRRIQDITRRDVLELTDAIVARGAPIMANRVLATIKKLFNWAVDRDYIEIPPTAGVKAPSKETSRARFLSDEEIRELWEAFEAEDYPAGPMFKFLLLTGQRVSEVARMRREDLVDGLWTIPDNKSGRPHSLVLPPQALAILEDLPKFEGPFVFSTTGGARPYQGEAKAKARAEERSGVTSWRLHDLRRTMATGMAKLGVPVQVTEAVLNHRSGAVSGIAAVYQRHDYAGEKGGALRLWADHLERLVQDG